MTKEEILTFAKDNDVNLNVAFWDDELWLNILVIPKEKRGQGIGTKVINMLKQYADEHDIPIKLLAHSCYGTEINKLKSIYRRLGFEDYINKKSKLTDFMIYDPTKHVDK